MKLKRILLKYKLVLYILFLTPAIGIPIFKHVPMIKDFAQISPAQVVDFTNLPSNILPMQNAPGSYACPSMIPGGGAGSSCNYYGVQYGPILKCYSGTTGSPYSCMDAGDTGSPQAKEGFSWTGNVAHFPSTNSYVYSTCSCPSAYMDAKMCGFCTTPPTAAGPYIESLQGGTTWDVDSIIKDWKTNTECGIAQVDVGGFSGRPSNFVNICTPADLTIGTPSGGTTAVNVPVSDKFTIDLATGPLNGDKHTVKGDSLPNKMDIEISDTANQNLTGTISGKNFNANPVAINKTANPTTITLDCTGWNHGTCIGETDKWGTETFNIKINMATVDDMCTIKITPYAVGSLGTKPGDPIKSAPFKCGSIPPPIENPAFKGSAYCVNPVGGPNENISDPSNTSVNITENGNPGNTGTSDIPTNIYQYDVHLRLGAPTNSVKITYTPSAGSNVQNDWIPMAPWVSCGGKAICLNPVPPAQTGNNIIYKGVDNTSAALNLTGTTTPNTGYWLIDLHWQHIPNITTYNYVVKNPSGGTVAQGSFTCSGGTCHGPIQINCPKVTGNYLVTISPSTGPTGDICDAYSPATYTAAITTASTSCPGFKCLSNTGDVCTQGYACLPCTIGQAGCTYKSYGACAGVCLKSVASPGLQFSPVTINGGIAADHVFLDRDLGQTGNLCVAAETITFSGKYKNIFQDINSSYLSNFKELGF